MGGNESLWNRRASGCSSFDEDFLPSISIDEDSLTELEESNLLVAPDSDSEKNGERGKEYDEDSTEEELGENNEGSKSSFPSFWKRAVPKMVEMKPETPRRDASEESPFTPESVKRLSLFSGSSDNSPSRKSIGGMLPPPTVSMLTVSRRRGSRRAPARTASANVATSSPMVPRRGTLARSKSSRDSNLEEENMLLRQQVEILQQTLSSKEQEQTETALNDLEETVVDTRRSRRWSRISLLDEEQSAASKEMELANSVKPAMEKAITLSLTLADTKAEIDELQTELRMSKETIKTLLLRVSQLETENKTLKGDSGRGTTDGCWWSLRKTTKKVISFDTDDSYTVDTVPEEAGSGDDQTDSEARQDLSTPAH